ncbi:MAG: DUF134 domain-containing protein [Bacteroidales bacterium]|nr:DUF134 domain-containing protein [Bacteroidales bacterium]
MARPKNLRRIDTHPLIKGYTPIDFKKNKQHSLVIINLEEYEAIRLCDYESMSQEEASLVMGISRPTFTRIYAHARKKVAKAFTEGKGIVFEGGRVFLDSDWYYCKECEASFNNYLHIASPICTLCGSSNIDSCTE